MDVMKNLFANLTSGVIRLLVTVGIIAAVGVFIVKPAIDGTNDAIKNATKGFDGFDDLDNPQTINHQIRQQIRQSNQEVKQAVHQAQQNLNHGGLNQSQQQQIRKQKKLLRCIQAANGDVKIIERCANRFQGLG